jgi:hypothetical protein
MDVRCCTQKRYLTQGIHFSLATHKLFSNFFALSDEGIAYQDEQGLNRFETRKELRKIENQTYFVDENGDLVYESGVGQNLVSIESP